MPSSDVDNRNNANRPVTGSLHPRVYTVLIGLALWMALWAWSFVGGGETDYILFIVTGFIVVVVALQLVLLRVRRADRPVDAGNSDRRAWADVVRISPGDIRDKISLPDRAPLDPGYNFISHAA